MDDEPLFIRNPNPNMTADDPLFVVNPKYIQPQNGKARSCVRACVCVCVRVCMFTYLLVYSMICICSIFINIPFYTY